MSARTIGDLLTEFGARPLPARDAGAERVVPFERKAAAPAAHPRQPSAEEREAEAYQCGLRDGQAAAMAECDAKLAELTTREDRQRADERSRWTVEQADALAAELRKGFEGLETNLAGSLARLLEPLCGKVVARQAVDEFASQLTVLLSDPARPPLQVSGPGDLLAMLRRKAVDYPTRVRYVPNDSCDVRLVCDHTVVETHLRVWTERLRAALQ